MEKIGNYFSQDYSLTETNSNATSRLESGELVQFPGEVTGTTPDKSFWTDPDSLLQMNFMGTPLPGYADLPLAPGKERWCRAMRPTAWRPVTS